MSLVTRPLFVVDYDLSPSMTVEVVMRDHQTSNTERIHLDIGSRLGMAITKVKYCVGYHVRDEYHEYVACPEKTSLATGFQCDRCRGRDILLPCMSCDGTKCDSVRSKGSDCNTTPTSVYLVQFGSVVKVGVSKTGRVLKRWVEQGAERGVEVAVAPNGQIARLAETAISQDLNLTKSVRLTTKIESISEARVQTDLISGVASQAFELAKEKYPQVESGKMESTDLAKYYPKDTGKRPVDLDVIAGKEVIGEFVGMKGPLFFFRDELEYFFDFRTLKGRLAKPASTKEQLSLTSFA
jgi:hypothetical protein